MIVGEHLQSGSAAALYLLSFLAASFCRVLSSCSRGCLHCRVRVGSHQKCCLGENREVLLQQLEMCPCFLPFKNQHCAVCHSAVTHLPRAHCCLVRLDQANPNAPVVGTSGEHSSALLCFRAAWPGTRTFVGKESSSSVTTGHVKIKLSAV